MSKTYELIDLTNNSVLMRGKGGKRSAKRIMNAFTEHSALYTAHTSNRHRPPYAIRVDGVITDVNDIALMLMPEDWGWQ